MIKKIDIKKFGLFQNYFWDVTIGKNESFRKVNIIYGRNYSGKTTLARIFKCIQDQQCHRDYEGANFSITLADQTVITPNNLNAFGQQKKMRIYSSDFVKENLSWLRNDDGTIEPFTVLGAKNVEVERRIREIDELLGSNDEKRGLIFDLTNKTNSLNTATENRDGTKNNLDHSLKEKAKAIKNNTAIYGKPVYTITHLTNEIGSATLKAILSDEQAEQKRKLLKDESKGNLTRLSEKKPNFSTYYSNVDSLLKRVIKPSEPIADLVNDALLQAWVRQGIDKHKDKRESCGFCGGPLSDSLWEKLDAHFNKESESLRQEIQETVVKLETAKRGLDGYIALEKDSFYSSFSSRFDMILKKWNIASKAYAQSITLLKTQLEDREKDIFTAIPLIEIIDESESIVEILKEFNLLIDENNLKTSTLSEDQLKAFDDLRISELAKFLRDIDYTKQLGDITKANTSVTVATSLLRTAKDAADALIEEKRTCEAQAKDESKGAELVNQHLNHFFGHGDLKLVATNDAGIVKFKIMRDKADAKNLSDGECSLISFCYFIAKIEDEMKEAINNDSLIVYIDDPISSLDSNHIFFMFSLIESIIAKPKKFGQLFISTHNLDFLKYLKKLSIPKWKPMPDSKGKPDVNHFLIERKGKENSHLRLSPNYLKHYITEFNYLFDQVYQCSISDSTTIEHEYQYNFGNNMRKFLEAYLFYKYPSQAFDLDQRLEKFFDSDQVTINLINRVVNEYSHLGEHVDRGLEPIDVDAMCKVAQAVITKIQVTDPQQFAALLDSISRN